MWRLWFVLLTSGASGDELDDIVPRCGQVALWTCAASLGEDTTLSQIEALLPIEDGGVSLAQLEYTAKQLGLFARAIQWTSQLPEDFDSAPAIIRVENPLLGPHFVAVVGRQQDHVLVIDFPRRGVWVTETDLREQGGWDGLALHIALNNAQLTCLDSPSGGRIALMVIVAIGCCLGCAMLITQTQRRRVSVARGGFTLIELLVVMGILSLLAGLALPAVQRTREQARRIDCANRLRQLGVAVGAFEATNGVLPSVSNPKNDPSSGRSFPSISELAQLLPYLEEAALYSQIQWDDESFADGDPPQSVRNREVQSVGLKVFRCPSDDAPERGTNYRFCTGTSPGFHQTINDPTPGAALSGVVGGGRRLSEITDGVSQTVFASERLAGDQDARSYTAWRDLLFLHPSIALKTAADAEQACSRANPISGHGSALGATWLFGAYGQTWYNHILPPNSDIPDCGYGPPMIFVGYAAVSARSWHSGGVNVLTGDGAVRFVNESVDLPLWRALGTIAGHESTSLDGL